MKKYHAELFAVAVVLMMTRTAFAQDIIDHTPLRQQGESVEWDKISIPPSDPYTLSYLPPRPNKVQDITQEDACLKAGGKWLDKIAYNQDYDLYGCSVHGKAEGLWRFGSRKIMKSGHKALKKKAVETPSMTGFPDEALGGYAWFLNGEEEGEMVLFHEEGKFVSMLQSYHLGKLDGPVMSWDERGQLVSFSHYENGMRDGQTAELNSNGMPEYYGNYAEDKPSGDWYIFNPLFGMLQYIKRYDRKVPSELYEKLVRYGNVGDDIRIVWVEEYDFMAQKKIKEGYRVEKTYEDPVHSGDMYDMQHFYDTNGEKWLDVMFGIGNVTDPYVTELCSPLSDYSFTHASRTLACVDEDDNAIKVIQFYPSNKIRTIETLDEFDDDDSHWRREEFYEDGSAMTKPASVLIRKFDDYYVPEEPFEYIYSKTDGEEKKQTGAFSSSKVINGSGFLTTYWGSGQIRTKGGFYDYNKNGEWSYYTENGAMYRQETYTNGVLDGYVKTWFGDGMPDQVYHYKSGIMHGDHAGYYTLGGVAWEAHHNMGHLTGVYREYTGTGSLKKEIDFDKPITMNGERLFPVTVYYSNGKVRAKGFDDGNMSEKRDGVWRLFLKSGEFWREVTYNSGDVVSKEAAECSAMGGEYVIDEDKLEEGCYLPLVNRESLEQPNKLRHGRWRWWNEDGALQREGTILLGHFYGKWRYFFPGGKPGVEPDEKYLMLEGTFDCDRPVGIWRGFYEGNVPKFDGQYDQNGVETGIWTTYHETGAVSSRGEFKDGKRVGEWEWRHENGALREKGTFENGEEIGRWQSWYPNGSEAGVGNYANGMRTGEWQWKRDNGEVWRKTVFVEGRDQTYRSESDETDE